MLTNRDRLTPARGTPAMPTFYLSPLPDPALSMGVLVQLMGTETQASEMADRTPMLAAEWKLLCGIYVQVYQASSLIFHHGLPIWLQPSSWPSTQHTQRMDVLVQLMGTETHASEYKWLLYCCWQMVGGTGVNIHIKISSYVHLLLVQNVLFVCVGNFSVCVYIILKWANILTETPQ